jgi:hypothetical protein
MILFFAKISVFNLKRWNFTQDLLGQALGQVFFRDAAPAATTEQIALNPIPAWQSTVSGLARHGALATGNAFHDTC